MIEGKATKITEADLKKDDCVTIITVPKFGEGKYEKSLSCQVKMPNGANKWFSFGRTCINDCVAKYGNDEKAWVGGVLRYDGIMKMGSMMGKHWTPLEKDEEIEL